MKSQVNSGIAFHCKMHSKVSSHVPFFGYTCILHLQCGMFSTPFVRRINALQFDDNNTQFVIAFSWQWQVIVVDCCSGIAVVVDCRGVNVLFSFFRS